MNYLYPFQNGVQFCVQYWHLQKLCKLLELSSPFQWFACWHNPPFDLFWIFGDKGIFKINMLYWNLDIFIKACHVAYFTKAELTTSKMFESVKWYEEWLKIWHSVNDTFSRKWSQFWNGYNQVNSEVTKMFLSTRPFKLCFTMFAF